MENRQSIHIPDVPVTETLAQLAAKPKATLVDVRTRTEWANVGVPDLKAIGKDVVLVELTSNPAMGPAPDFVDRVDAALRGLGVAKTDDVYLICRSGARSRTAAGLMAQAGYQACRNVAGGFEGANGWKAAGLAWKRG